MHIQVNRVIFINFLSHSNIAVVNTLQCVVLNITQYCTRLLSLNLQFFTRDDLQLSSYNFRNLWLNVTISSVSGDVSWISSYHLG